MVRKLEGVRPLSDQVKASMEQSFTIESSTYKVCTIIVIAK